MYGGAASGKSRYAEDLLCALSGEGPRIYLATMEAMDEESRARVRRHRALRQNKGFSTLECPRDLDGLARQHRLAAGRCGRVIEVVCGLPVIWKEECC